jgi:hypothetical protein
MKPDDLDPVFAAPLGDFTRERDRLAQRLREAGDAEAARRVLALRRPTGTVWATNQLARREPAAVRALLDAGARLAHAQAQALQRGGDAEALRATSDDFSSALEEAAERAQALLGAGGHRATLGTRRTLSQTLRAAATGDSEAREALRRGHLERDLVPASVFGAPSSLPRVPSPARTPGEKAAKGREAVPPARQTAAVARAEAARKRARRDLERRVSRAVALAEREERAARTAEQAAARAERAARAAEQAAARARAGADVARRDADRLRAELERLR